MKKPANYNFLYTIAFLFLCNLNVVAQGTLKSAANGRFTSDSVHFNNATTGLQYGGTLTLPVTQKSVAAVVIMSGTGKQDQDGTMAGHKVFKTIAEYLSARGIAVLRLDDRGVGKTTGNYETSTTGDFANDALAALAYLKSRREINAAKIGLLGHSEGGISISVAASESKDVKFLVSMAGVAMNGLDNLIRQNEDIVNAATLPEYDKKRSNEINNLMFQTAFTYADSSNMEQKLMQTYTDWKKKDSVYFNSLHIQFDHFRFPLYSYVNQATGPWYRYFVKYDAEKVLSKVTVPILALNGNKDILVAWQPNLENWKRIPFKAGNHQVTTVVIPDVNHLFLPCVTCTLKEYSTIKSDVSPEALVLISQWINKISR